MHTLDTLAVIDDADRIKPNPKYQGRATMTFKGIAILTVITAVYLAVMLLTGFSLTGYFTDAIVSVFLVSFGLTFAFTRRSSHAWLTRLIRTLTILSSIVVFGIIAIHLAIPFSWGKLNTTSFFFQEADGRLFNAYFTPVGAYSGGEGNFWITESPRFFPIIEIEKYHKHAVLWDFTISEWEGEPVDQNEVILGFIEDEVLAPSE